MAWRPSIAYSIPEGKRASDRGAAAVTERGPLTRHAGKLQVVACGRSWRLGPESRGTQALGSPPHLGLELRPRAHGALAHMPVPVRPTVSAYRPGIVCGGVSSDSPTAVTLL